MTPIVLRIKCIKCGEEKDIEQKGKYKTNRCLDCTRKAAREANRKKAEDKGRRAGVNGRVPYPLEDKWKYPLQKFQTIGNKMKKIKQRKDWIEQIKINLDETLNNPLVMHWINGHTAGDDDTQKKQKKIENDFPDTRYLSWDEYKLGLDETETDS